MNLRSKTWPPEELASVPFLWTTLSYALFGLDRTWDYWNDAYIAKNIFT